MEAPVVVDVIWTSTLTADRPPLGTMTGVSTACATHGNNAAISTMGDGRIFVRKIATLNRVKTCLGLIEWGEEMKFGKS